jgi:hypothetical protein
MIFNVKSKKNAFFIYTLSNDIKRQNISVKFFSCTLVGNSITTKNDSPTSFVFVFNFVNYTTK